MVTQDKPEESTSAGIPVKYAYKYLLTGIARREASFDIMKAVEQECLYRLENAIWKHDLFPDAKSFRFEVVHSTFYLDKAEEPMVLLGDHPDADMYTIIATMRGLKRIEASSIRSTSK